MAQLITFQQGNEKESLIDIAVSVITGDVETLILPFELNADGVPTLGATLVCETDIIPTNGNNNRLLIGMDDDDQRILVPTNGKAVKGNLFVGYRLLGGNGIGTAVSSEIETFLNDVRQVLDDANAFQITSTQLDANNLLVATDEQAIIVFGFIKETQTEDYNPLSVINPNWLYQMFDKGVVNDLYDEALDE